MMTTVIILLCILLSFFFSGMETGVLLLSRARVRHLKEKGFLGARILMDFLQFPTRLSSTVLVGNTIANGVGTFLVGYQFLHEEGPWRALGAVLLFAFLLWFFGELISKALFRRFPNRLTALLAPVLLIFYYLFWPIVQGFVMLTQMLVRLMGGRITSRQMFVTRDELKLLSREGREGLALAGEQRNLVATILESQHAVARDIMKPRKEVVSVREDSLTTDRLKVASQNHFYRLPVEAASDGASKPWVGLWVAYDLIFLPPSSDGPPLRQPPRVPMEMHLDEVLVTCRKQKSPVAFVQDKEGNDIGLVTLEDVLRRYIGKVDL
jgi:CBS domain containing-hemolysin-like protein